MITTSAFDPVQLAIVIPAFKSQFLARTLESICVQTDKRFCVYVGDDHSPEDISSICQSFKDGIDLVYKRFDHNLGQQTLTGHWDRCVRMSYQPWVWLFSDDDVMEPQCVESFYGALETTKSWSDTFRFNTLLIDEQDQILRFNPPHPQLETGWAFAYHRLMFHRYTCVTEYIFSRRAFERENGFVDLPLAWPSDDASLIAFAGANPIYTIAGPHVRWRLSTENISGKWAAYQTKKIDGLLQYLDWLDVRYKNAGKPDDHLSENWVTSLGRPWFYRQLRETRVFLSFSECFHLARRLNSVWHDGEWTQLRRLAMVDAEWMYNWLVRSIALCAHR